MFKIPTTVEIADGTYPAVVEAIESGHGNFGPYRKWSFLVEHDGKVDSISAMTSGHLGPGSKAYKWLSGIYGKSLKAGEEVEDPTGKRCLVTVIHKENGFPTVSEISAYAEPQQTLPGVPR